MNELNELNLTNAIEALARAIEASESMSRQLAIAAQQIRVSIAEGQPYHGPQTLTVEVHDGTEYREGYAHGKAYACREILDFVSGWLHDREDSMAIPSAYTFAADLRKAVQAQIMMNTPKAKRFPCEISTELNAEDPLTEPYFVVEYPGDRSVGIFGESFEVKGPFEFESLEDKAAFMKGIYDAFGAYGDENRQVIPGSVYDAPDDEPGIYEDNDLDGTLPTNEQMNIHLNTLQQSDLPPVDPFEGFRHNKIHRPNHPRP